MEEMKLILNQNMLEYERGKKLIPGAVLGIRRPYNFVEGEYPIYFESGKGCRVKDIDKNEYIDYLCAYGPIILGYREEEVDDAAIEQIREKGFCFSLTQKIQNDLAEKLTQIIPSAQKTVFVKTGSDATTLAVRISRAFTGRSKIIRCGYHGWHDWCVEVKGGIPQKLYEDTLEFHYNHLEELEELMKKHGDDTAAIIITPVGHPLGHRVEEPQPGFLEGVRELSLKYGSVLIFDEIRSGFRIAMGGAQEKYRVTPDMSVFGKAMANGYAISAVTGREDIMNMVEKEVFVSSTFFPNSISFAAALKTIEILERDRVLEDIEQKGIRFLKGISAAVKKYDTGAEVSGIPQMPFITFKKDDNRLYKDKRNEFYTQLIRRNVFLQPYHHGYICMRHTEEDLSYTVNAIEESLEYVYIKYRNK